MMWWIIGIIGYLILGVLWSWVSYFDFSTNLRREQINYVVFRSPIAPLEMVISAFIIIVSKVIEYYERLLKIYY